MTGWVARPQRTLITSIVLSVALALTFGAGWFFMPADIRQLFTVLQIGTLIFFGLFMIAFMMLVGLSELRLSDDGLDIRNGLSRRHLAWSEIDKFRFREGDPWAYAYLRPDHPSGKERVQLLAISQTDGARAQRLFRELCSFAPSN